MKHDGLQSQKEPFEALEQRAKKWTPVFSQKRCEN